MIYNNNSLLRTIITFLVIICCTISCKIEQPAPSGHTWVFMPRECKYLLVNNGYIKPLSAEQIELAKKLGLSMEGMFLKVSEDLPSDFTAAEFCLLLDVTSYTLEMLKDANLDNTKFLTSPDYDMENIMDEEMRRSSRKTRSIASAAPMMAVDFIEYRKEELKSLKISSTSKLFGLEPGADLTSHFEIWGDASNPFLFDYSKKYLGKLERHMSIRDYLALRPIVSPSLILHIKDTPPEMPLDAEFIVEIELTGGKVLRGSTSIALTK